MIDQAMLWAKLGEFEAESAAGDLAHRDVMWLTERVRTDALRIEELSKQRDLAREDLAKVVAILNGETVELPLKTSGFRYVGKLKP